MIRVKDLGFHQDAKAKEKTELSFDAVQTDEEATEAPNQGGIEGPSPHNQKRTKHSQDLRPKLQNANEGDRECPKSRPSL